MKKTIIAAVVSGIMATLTAFAAENWLESFYRNDTVVGTSTSIVYTNGSERVTLASVMVQCLQATSTWNIALVNNNITNVIKTGTLTLASPTLIYEGYGTVPLGASGRILVTGSIHTNNFGTNVVAIAIHTKGQ